VALLINIISSRICLRHRVWRFDVLTSWQA